MRPHLAHIMETLYRKQAAVSVGDQPSTYQKYRNMVITAKQRGFTNEAIIFELEQEKKDIMADNRKGDDLFMQGQHNAQVACLSAITLLIKELKGENDGAVY